jgi:hypothetical protein
MFSSKRFIVVNLILWFILDFFYKVSVDAQITSHVHIQLSQTQVAHGCNPSYSRGRDQEDDSAKPARANSS